MIGNLILLHCSFTGGTLALARALAGALAAEVQEYDLTDPCFEPPAFNKNTTVLVACPVFMGRLAAPATSALQKLNGGGAKTIALVVYGNRNYDDALVEIADTLEGHGFSLVAAGAFIARHTLVPAIAAGRPSKQDFAGAAAFANAVLLKLATGRPTLESTLPGQRPYRTLPMPKAQPQTGDACTACGLCAAKCPVGAIPQNSPGTTEKGCILCMRCVYICPEAARRLPEEFALRTCEYMLANYAAPKANEYYL